MFRRLFDKAPALVTGHYARRDIFELCVDSRPKIGIVFRAS